MVSFIEALLAMLVVIAFGIWVYSMFKKESFMDVLNDIKDLITKNE